MIQQDCLQIQRSVAIAFDPSIYCPQCSNSFESDIPNRHSSNGDSSNGVSSNGDSSNGDSPNGDIPNGDSPNGDSPNGGEPNGGEPNGGEPNGDSTTNVPNGDNPNGDEPYGGIPNGCDTNDGGPNDGDPTAADNPNGDNPNGDIPNGDIPNSDSPIRNSSLATETSIIEFTPPKPIHRNKTHIALSQEFEQRILSVNGVLDLTQPSKLRLKSECVGMTQNELKMILTKKKPVGIKNSSNMCYFISAIIMLMDIEPLWDFMVNKISSLSKDDRLTKYMSMALLSVGMRVYMKDPNIDLFLFKEALGKITREDITFKIGEQDNVECVLGDIINQIQFELSPNDQNFNDIYGLKINALKICQACSTIVQDEQAPSTIIFLNVPDKDNWDLQTLWDDYQNNEGYNDDYPCKRCAKSQKCKEKFIVMKCPPPYIMLSPFRTKFVHQKLELI